MGKVKSHFHDELERRRAYEAHEEDEREADLSAAEDRAWAAAKAAKRAEKSA